MAVDIKRVFHGTDDYDDEATAMWGFHFEEEQCCGASDDGCDNRFFEGQVNVHAPTLIEVAAELHKVAIEIENSL